MEKKNAEGGSVGSDDSEELVWPGEASPEEPGKLKKLKEHVNVLLVQNIGFTTDKEKAAKTEKPHPFNFWGKPPHSKKW